MQEANFLGPCGQSTCRQNYKAFCKCTKCLRLSDHGCLSLLMKCSHCWAGSLACLYHPCPALPWLRGDSLGDNLQFLGKLSCLRPQEDLWSTSNLTGGSPLCVLLLIVITLRSQSLHNLLTLMSPKLMLVLCSRKNSMRSGHHQALSWGQVLKQASVFTLQVQTTPSCPGAAPQCLCRASLSGWGCCFTLWRPVLGPQSPRESWWWPKSSDHVKALELSSLYPQVFHEQITSPALLKGRWQCLLCPLPAWRAASQVKQCENYQLTWDKESP